MDDTRHAGPMLVPIGDIAFELRMEQGPITVRGKRHASYVDHARHLIRVNACLPAQERIWAACCAVAAASVPVQGQLAACPLVGTVD
jgi:hypothetical protein